ncbi:hypothetical protein DL96DRAFT_554784 [Flagelloscypha sp. PMI_526]|nr:hypothetical protein DL96DRAFT_554784 [Flagelloscypha sp. PMI_526]
MASFETLPPELYPAIFQYSSTADLKSYALTNSLFRNLAQHLLFSFIRMVDKVGRRIDFFRSPRGHLLLLKHARSLVLGHEFWRFKDRSITCSFLRELDGTTIRSLLLKDYSDRDGIHGTFLDNLRITVMPHLRSLAIYNIENVKFTKILSHCPLLRHVELRTFTTSRNDGVTYLKTLPQIRSLTLIHWNVLDLAPFTTLGAYLNEKGSYIETLSLENFVDDGSGKACTMDLFPTLKPSLHQLRFGLVILRRLIGQGPLHLNELPNLESLYFTINLETIRWSLFQQFFDQHIEQECFPSSLKDVYLWVVATRSWSVGFRNSEEAISPNTMQLGLPANCHIRLRVAIRIYEGVMDCAKAVIKPMFEEYDPLQKALESSLWRWSQVSRLIVTRHYEYIPW